MTHACNTKWLRGLAYTVTILTFVASVSPLAQADVIEASDDVFGAGSLTIDTDQELEFLDVTFSLGLSVNAVSSELGFEGAFEGFRYATAAEVASLVNNFGFSPGAVGSYPVYVAGNLGSDQLSGLVSLLGVTATISSPASRLVQGYAESLPGCTVPVITIRDFSAHPTLGNDDTFAIQGCSGPSNSAPSLGSFLVRPAVMVPGYSCLGFANPLDDGPVTVKNNRAIPFKATLLDPDGFEINDTNIPEVPVLQVLFSDGTSAATDVTSESLPAGNSTEGNQFEYRDGHWQFNLLTRNFSAPGTYSVSLESGDSTQYVVDPLCLGTFVIE